MLVVIQMKREGGLTRGVEMVVGKYRQLCELCGSTSQQDCLVTGTEVPSGEREESELMLGVLTASLGWVMDSGTIHREKKHRTATFQVEMRGGISKPLT